MASTWIHQLRHGTKIMPQLKISFFTAWSIAFATHVERENSKTQRDKCSDGKGETKETFTLAKARHS
jgi:hypothetical protein